MYMSAQIQHKAMRGGVEYYVQKKNDPRKA